MECDHLGRADVLGAPYSEAVSEGPVERSFPRALLAALVIPLVAVPIAAFLVFSHHRTSGLPVAQGAIGGAFHPVAGNFAPDSRALDECGDKEYACLEQAYGNISYNEGPKAAFALFDERIATDNGVRTDCHRIAHNIGSAAYARFDGNVAKTFSLGSATCASGYYHGVLERAFVGVTSTSGLERVARSLCVGNGVRRFGYLDYQCRHGLGHGMMIQTGYDLSTVLSLCARLGTGWDDVTCTSGAFMENLNTRYGFRSAWLKDEDPIYPCNSVAVRDRRSCYVRATTRILELNGGDFAKTAATCALVDPRWAAYCFRGYGRDAVGEARYGNKRILALCGIAAAAEAECLFGASRTIMDGFGAKGATRAAALCRQGPAGTQASCFSGVGVVLGLLAPSPSARRSACARITRAYVEQCASAAASEVDPTGRLAWG